MGKKQREINIICNEPYRKFMQELGKTNFFNSWNLISITSDNETNIYGIIYNVEFVDGDEGGWFEIDSIDDRTIKLKKWNKFHTILQ